MHNETKIEKEYRWCQEDILFNEIAWQEEEIKYLDRRQKTCLRR
jgi:hypothetical protein